MFKIEQDHIWLTRGDSAEFRPLIQGYEAVEGDKVIFAMSKSANGSPALRIEVNCGENIAFTHENTYNLPTGSYLYDIKIKTLGGQTSTFVNGARFELLEDIDHGGN